MKDEQVLLCEGGGSNERLCPVGEIIVPDIQWTGLFVTKPEQAVINFAYESAMKVLAMILQREKQYSYKDKFTIDVPDLWFIAMGQKPALRKSLRDEIMEFSVTYIALVCHFLPKATQTGYSYDGQHMHGVKYKGVAWVSGE